LNRASREPVLGRADARSAPVIDREAQLLAALPRHLNPSQKSRPDRGCPSKEERVTVTTESTWRNGVDVAALFATLDAVKAESDNAKFRWVSETHGQGIITGYMAPAGTSPRTQLRPRRRRPSGSNEDAWWSCWGRYSSWAYWTDRLRALNQDGRPGREGRPRARGR